MEIVKTIFDTTKGGQIPASIKTIEDFRKEFAQPVKTPINEINITDNVFQKILNTDRGYLTGTIRPTLERPDFILQDTDGSNLLVKLFANEDGTKNYNIIVINKTSVESEMYPRFIQNRTVIF